MRNWHTWMVRKGDGRYNWSYADADWLLLIREIPRMGSSAPARILLLVLLLGAACQQPAPTADAQAEALNLLRTADSSLQAAITARDLEATTAFYADDAVIMPLAKPGATGRDAVRDEWAHNFGIPGFNSTMTLAAVDVSQDGTMGVTRGTYATSMKAPDGAPIVERGKWVSVWRRVSGGPWRITVDIFNTDSLPPDHQASTADGHDH